MPGAFPAYSLLSAFGQAAPLNLDYQRAGRVLPFPFHFLNNNHAMNVKPLHYEWPDFYGRVADLTRYSFSASAIARRFGATAGVLPRVMNLVRALSTEGHGRLRYYKDIRRRLLQEPGFLDYFEGRTTVLPRFYVDAVRKRPGPALGLAAEGRARARPERVPGRHPGLVAHPAAPGPEAGPARAPARRRAPGPRGGGRARRRSTSRSRPQVDEPVGEPHHQGPADDVAERHGHAGCRGRSAPTVSGADASPRTSMA